MKENFHILYYTFLGNLKIHYGQNENQATINERSLNCEQHCLKK